MPTMAHSINISGRLLLLDKPLVMAIINVTPDSYYTQSRVQQQIQVLQLASKHLSEGANIIDIGGCSTRPNSAAPTIVQELERVIPAVKWVKQHFKQAIVSVDTYRAEVARQALEAGADLINDVSGGEADPNMYAVVAKYKVPYILNHTIGLHSQMAQNHSYTDLLVDINLQLSANIAKALDAGIVDIIIDPGFGFGKTIAQNYELLAKLDLLGVHQKPILVGLSRKSMIYRPLKTTADNVLPETQALHMLALQKGANILRVHDTKTAINVVNLHNYVNNYQPTQHLNQILF